MYLKILTCTKKRNIIKIKSWKFVVIYKIGKELITFVYIEVEKHKLHQYTSSVSIFNVNFDRIRVPSKLPFGKKDFKYFIRYRDGKKDGLLCVMP